MFGGIGGIAASALQSSVVKAATSAITGRTLQLFSTAKGAEAENAKLILKAEIDNRGPLTHELLQLSIADKLEFAVLILEREIPRLERFITQHPSLLRTVSIPAHDMAHAMIKFHIKTFGGTMGGEPIPETGFKILEYLFRVRANSNELFYDIVRWFAGQMELDLSHLSDSIKRLFNLIKTRHGLANDFALFTTFNHNRIHFYPYMEFKNNSFPTGMNDKLFYGSTFERCEFFPGCDFTNTDLQSVTFNFCVCNEAKFLNSKLNGSILSRSFFKDTKFLNTNLDQSRITHCEFESAFFQKAEQIIGNPTSFIDAFIGHSNFNSALFKEVLIGPSNSDEDEEETEETSNGNFSHNSFSLAELSHMDLSNVTLDGNEFKECKIISCTLGKNKELLQEHIVAT
jgi:uncharacterized protein YjbI with pentapeptide repeats